MLVMDYDCFFVYKGKGYLGGTKIKLKQEYIDSTTYNGKKIWPYAYLSARSSGQNGNGKYMFSRYNMNPYQEAIECTPWFTIEQKDLENAIEEILVPREIEIVPKTKKKDWECNQVMVGWVIYIAVLLASFIFRDWVAVWVFASIYFFVWRNHELWED